MKDLNPSDEEQERLDEIDWREYDDECECTCGDENPCPYHAEDRIVESHEIWRTL